MRSKAVVLPALTLGAIAFLLGGTGAHSDANAPRGGPQHLEGSWFYTVNVAGVPPGFPLAYSSLITFDRDGGLVQTAWTPPMPAVVGEVVGVSPWIGHGEWVRIGSFEFALTVLIPRFDSAGVFVGLAKARSSIKLNRTAREASGRFNGDIFDSAGNLVLTGFGGNVSASRLQVESVK